MSLQTPVAFILFRRPETTARVWEKIREARPAKLFLIADGGRNEEEWEKCRAARKVVETIDWECEVHRNFSDTNLGCRNRVVSGLDWVFEQVEEAIILEDDCLPSSSFFRFCEELLIRYKDDSRIMHVAGNNFQDGVLRGGASYYFSKYAHIWGWATWRRAWSKREPGLKSWNSQRTRELIERNARTELEGLKLNYRFNLAHEEKINTWDYGWLFTVWINNGLSCIPNENLVANIGFGEGGTHTSDGSNPAYLINMEIEFPLLHPTEMMPDNVADIYSFNKYFTGPLPQTSLVHKIKKGVKAFASELKKCGND